jgi:hypothetical protein
MRALIIALVLLTKAVAIAAIVWAFGGPGDNAPDAKSIDSFVAEFDRNIQNVPIAADLVAHDAKLRAHVLEVTKKAFANGGWKAADDALTTLMRDKEPQVTWAKLHADDSLLLALWRRYLDATRGLRATPAACRYYQSGMGGNSLSFPSIQNELKAASRAAQAAYFSGARNLAAGTAPEIPPPDVVNTLLAKAEAGGKRLTEAEWDAVNRGAYGAGPDELFCAASIKFDENILALPGYEAVAAIRGYWGRWIVEQGAVPHG